LIFKEVPTKKKVRIIAPKLKLEERNKSIVSQQPRKASIKKKKVYMIINPQESQTVSSTIQKKSDPNNTFNDLFQQ